MERVELQNGKDQSEGSSAKTRKERLKITPRVLILAGLLLVLVVIFLRLTNITLVPAPDISIVELEEFEAQFSSTSNSVVVDIRDYSLYKQSRLPGAIWGGNDPCHLFRGLACEEKDCSERQTYFYYSGHGEDYQEVRKAIERTKGRGCWEEVYLLDGGFDAWVDAELEVEL
ncbi:MAG: rhodanese-like domain-containing protein [bacterium]